MKPVLPFAETMATQACNLSCQGCTNYSDLPFNGHVTWAQARSWIEPWLERIDISDFGIIGGEPLLNPEIESWFYGCRELMPDSQLRFTTNGLLIKSVADLLKIFDDIGNIVFKITVHVESPELEDTVQEIFSARAWQPVNEHGIDRWALSNGVRFQVNRPQQFLLTYKNNYENMMPHLSDPERAFDLCIQKTCPLLWNGRLYKCSTAGLLGEILDKINPATREHWIPFVDPGISPDSGIEDINRFIANFGRPHRICAQCPDNRRFAIDHRSTVALKKYRPQRFDNPHNN